MDDPTPNSWFRVVEGPNCVETLPISVPSWRKTVFLQDAIEIKLNTYAYEIRLITHIKHLNILEPK